ncbi:MAG: HipA domain-containing protein [Bacteroidales bacterium]|nr:HipA domain-containing protein [Bacteroidales bacterium]
MKNKMNCLLCYKPLTDETIDYHPICVKIIFGTNQIPLIDIDEKKLTEYAQKIVGANSTITGVQPKLSLWLEESKKNIRFTIIDGRSNYILKPQSNTYTSLPENEDLCMHLAHVFGIETAIHGLIRLPSGSTAYLTKRFDRDGENKLTCEDLCQLTETLTEYKYRGSYEKTGKAVKQYSTQAGLDALRYFELVLFSFITANADMHLKNFSMLEKEEGVFALSPAYDLVNTALAIKNETEQIGLTLNGRKNKITKKDFDVFGISLALNDKQMQNCYQSFLKQSETAAWWIDNSFLPEEQKELFKQIVSDRLQLLTTN